jgi:hypothetical protein
MANKVSLFNAYRIHPGHDVRGHLIEGKALAITPHCSKAWQVY